MTRYTTYGSVRGCCGHQHQSMAAAQRCAEEDWRSCAGLGGGAYSDRRVVAVVDGYLNEVDEDGRPGEPLMVNGAGVRFAR